MPTPQDTVLPGTLFDETALLTLEDLSRICALDTHRIIEFVEEGVLNVTVVESQQWRFSGAAVRRARLAARLERDLELNLAGVALALTLLEEIQQLRRDLRARR
jgi:chaperone modulatory protein CbpM